MRRDLDIDLRPRGARARAARPLDHEGDLPALRVPQPPAASRRARRRAPRRRAGARSPGSRRRGSRGARPRSGAWLPSSRRTAASRLPSSTHAVVVTGELDGLAAALRDSERLVVHASGALPRDLWRAGLEPAEDTEIAAYLIDPNRSGYLLDDLAAEYGLEAQPEPARRAGDRGARPPGGRHARARRSPARAPRGAGARFRCIATSSCRSPSSCARWRTRASRSTRTGWARSRPVSPIRSRSSRRARRSWRASRSCSGRPSRSRGSCSRRSGSSRAARARPATRPTRACCGACAPTIPSWR